MKVELINVDRVSQFFKEWGEFACECYNTDKKYAERVGRACLKDEHFSGSRTFYFNFKISDIDRGTAEQVLRHEIGTRAFDQSLSLDPTMMAKNMKSFRYVDVAKDGLKYSIPPLFQKNERLKQEFISAMESAEMHHKRLYEVVSEEFPQLKGESLIENINAVLPRATNTSLVIGLTIEAIIEIMHLRLCSRTQDLHRKLAVAIKKELLQYLPELKDYLVPKCVYLTWCPEKKSCGLRPRKEELAEKEVSSNAINFKLTSDLNKAVETLIAVQENDGYCPCMIAKNEDTKCPCKDKRENNICICGLYE